MASIVWGLRGGEAQTVGWKDTWGQQLVRGERPKPPKLQISQIFYCSNCFFGLDPNAEAEAQPGGGKNFGAAAGSKEAAAGSEEARGQRPKPPLLRSLTSSAALHWVFLLKYLEVTQMRGCPFITCQIDACFDPTKCFFVNKKMRGQRPQIEPPVLRSLTSAAPHSF